MRKIIYLVLTIFLINGCVNKAIICSQIKGNEFKPMIMRVYSFKYNVCQLRCYDFNVQKSLPWKDCGLDVEGQDPIIEEPEACDNTVGFSIDDQGTEIKPRMKKLQNLYMNLCD